MTLNVSPEDLPLGRAYHWEKTRPHEVFLTQPVHGVARDWTWEQTMDEARRIANHLIGKNWPAGSNVVILSKNCAWWIMADIAIWMAGHVSVPIYPSLTVASAKELFEHCSPVACFVGEVDSPDLASQAIPLGLHSIRFPTASAAEGHGWNEIVASTSPLAASPVRAAEDIATIIYTSGTTGSPKGALHRFAAFPCFAKAIAQVAGDGRQRALSYLPLAHIAERGLTEASAIQYSWHLFFTEGAESFLTDLKRAHATVFFSVPRLYLKFQQKVFEKISRHTLDGLMKVSLTRRAAGSYILRSMGLAEVTFAASGSAPLPPELLQWFLALGLPLTEGYGATETGITHTALHGESKPGWTGKNAPGVETKISETGEVLVRSPMSMAGYYKNSEGTKEAFTEDGFIHTGDLGEITADGWLKITGRIKELFKTSKGKYVSPAKIEALVSAHPAVENCLVLGSNLAAPFAVVVLTHAASQPADKSALGASFEDLRRAANGRVEAHERLAFIVLTNEHWTIERGFVTPTLKLRRARLEAFYQPLIAGWAGQEAEIVWHLI